MAPQHGAVQFTPTSAQIKSTFPLKPMEDAKAPDVTATAPGSLPEGLLTLSSLGLIAEHLSEPVFVKAPDHRFVLANHAFCELVQQPRDALLGRTEEPFNGHEGGAHESLVLQSRTVVRAQRKFATADGVSEAWSATYLPLTDEQGLASYVACILGAIGATPGGVNKFQDELDRYAVEQSRALRAVQQEMLRRERLMVLRQITAVMAHQVRNPLTEIRLALALARKHTPADAEALKYTLHLADVGAREANRIITEIVDYATHRTPHPMYMPLPDIVSAALEDEPPPADVTVTLDIPNIEVFVDPQQTRDALSKVIRNANEAMAHHGGLILEAHLRCNAEQDPEAQFVELRICDSGMGVSEQLRTLLFEPMVTGKPLGLGLGLTTARALIVQQGGTLECLPDIESGAVFVMTLPLHRQPLEHITSP